MRMTVGGRSGSFRGLGLAVVLFAVVGMGGVGPVQAQHTDLEAPSLLEKGGEKAGPASRKSSSYEVGAKAGNTDYTIKDAIQRIGGSLFPGTELNVRPDRQAVPAGDVDGDGVNDWLYQYSAADDRVSDPSATTPKSFLRYGGATFGARYYDDLYYRSLDPVGNFVGTDNADAISLLDQGQGGFEIYEGGGQGYQQVATRTQNTIAGEKMPPVDLNGDGYDDIVYVRSASTTIQVVFGGQTPDDVTYGVFSPSTDRASSFSYAAGDPDEDDAAEILRVAGDNTSSGPDASLAVDLFSLDQSEGLTSEQSFTISNPEMIAADYRTSLANIDGAGLQEIILQEEFGESNTFVFTSANGTYETTPETYRPNIRAVGDLNGDGRADFVYRDTNTPKRYIALGPADVTAGLSGDFTLGETSSVVTLPMNQRGAYGDLDGDGRDEVIGQVQTTTQFGPRLLNVSADGSSMTTSDVLFDNGPYNESTIIQTVAVGDWGGGSTNDVAFVQQATKYGANQGRGKQVGSVEVYFGDPMTAMLPDLTLTHPNNVQPKQVVAGDFTGNGIPNVAVSWGSTQSLVEIYEAGDGNTPVHSIDLGHLDPDLEPQYFPPSSIGNVGDVNDDGADDLLIGAPRSNKSDSTFLYLGGADISTQPDEQVIVGALTSGSSIQGLGDINGDGIDDFAVGAGVPNNGTGSGEVDVFFGESTSSPDFSSPDVSISPTLASGESIRSLGHLMTVGDFNGDDVNDLAVSSIFHRLSDGEGTEAIRIYQGGQTFDGTPERKLYVPGPPLGLFQQYYPASIGELTALPDFNGDGSSELLYGTYASTLAAGTNALIYAGNGTEKPTPTRVLRAPDQSVGLGADNNNTLNGNLGSAAGDFNGDGRVELLMLQEQATGYRDTPVFTYQPSTAAEDEEPPTTTSTSTVDASSDTDTEKNFGETGTSVTFSDKTSGTGDVTVEQYDGDPVNGGTIDARNVSSYRVEISLEGDLEVGDGTEIRFDVSKIDGVTDPAQVSIYTREIPGLGGFKKLSTTYEHSSKELVATVSGFSEFAFGSNTEPLPVELADFQTAVDDGTVQLSWTTVSETNNTGFQVQRRRPSNASGASERWTDVGFVRGAGTTSQAQSYRFTDAAVPYEADRLTYRLKQVDADGRTNYSPTRTVDRKVTEVQLLGTFPNPAQHQATVRYALPETQEVTIRLYDVLGREVRTVTQGKREGRYEQHVDLGELSSGVYFLRLQSDGEVRTQKLTVVR